MMLRKKLLYYGSVMTMLSSLSACSAFEYVAQQKTYKIVTSQPSVSALSIDPVTDKDQSRSPAFYTKNRVSLLAIKKNNDKHNRDLGSIYLKNSFAQGSKKDILFELSYNRKGYKASTPLFYSGDTMRGGLAFMVTRNRRLFAGFEFTIKLNK